MQVIDFTSLWIPGTDANAAAALPGRMKQVAAAGVGGVVIGFDDTAASDLAIAAVLGAGMTWAGAYRFLYWDLPVTQVQSCLQGIHDFAPDDAHLPWYCIVDAEENYDANGNITIRGPANAPAYFHQLMDYVESHGVKPTEKVQPAIYTRLDWFLTYCPGYTEPADRGWGLWTSEPGRGTTPDTCALYANWQRSQIVGVQTALNQSAAIGQVDMSIFRDVAPPQPTPVTVSSVSSSVALSDGRVLVWPS